MLEVVGKRVVAFLDDRTQPSESGEQTMHTVRRLSVAALVVALTCLYTCGTARAATVLGYWKFDEFNADGNHNGSGNFQVIDSTGNGNHLYTWDSNGYNYTDSTDLPPAALFAGSNSRSVIPDTTDSAVMFHEVGLGGDDFDFAGKSFTLEGFFKTDGDQSGAGRMEILYNSQSNFSYLVNLNEGGAGVIRFATGSSPYPQVNLGGGAGHNYADGQWHYFIARYEEKGAGEQDVLSLATYDDAGNLIEQGQSLAPVGFDMAATSGNMSVGSVVHTTHFQGTLDDIRITLGLVESKWQLNNVRVAVDTFDNTHDYKAAGTAGTIWDGLLGADNATVVATSNSPTLSGDGNLEITVPGTVNAGWDHVHNNAPYLFKNVSVAEDFDAQMVVESTTAAPYSSAGLMVRLADPLADGVGGVNNQEDFLSLIFDNWSGDQRNRRRSLDDGAASDLFLTPNGTQHSFLRITREGDLLSLYTRAADGDPWILQETLVRPDLAGNVQVGVWYGLFGAGNTGTAQLENFILTTTVPEPSTFLLVSLGVVGLALTCRRRRRGH